MLKENLTKGSHHSLRLWFYSEKENALEGFK